MISVKSFFLRILPYLISMVFGIIIFAVAYKIEVHYASLADLLVNISAGLLSIPLIFICYEVVSKICSRDLKSTLFKSISFEINSALVSIINDTRKILGFDNFVQLSDMNETLKLNSDGEVLRRLKLLKKVDDNVLNDLSKNKTNLSNLMHKSSTLEVLDNEQIKYILNIVRETDIMHKKFTLFKNDGNPKNLATVRENLSSLRENILEWVESYETSSAVGEFKN